MIPKIKVGLIYGGKSPEHNVSKMTAQSVLKNIDHGLFNVKKIYIDRNGDFDKNLLKDIDVAFLAVHGPNCEDGKLQQYLEQRNIKYTGSGIEASRINMNKTLQHKTFKKAGLLVTKYRGFDRNGTDQIEGFIKKNGLPVFIKPNNSGSSIGICKVGNINDVKKAVDEAFKFDCEICIEKAVENPREIELAILGNNDLVISNPGEVLSKGEFYSYETKYFKPFGTTTQAVLNDKEINEFKDLAKQAYRATGCKGYARVDFLLSDNKIYINEINTLPGFTKISMFPKLMTNIGIDYKKLITKIIELALE